MLFRSAEPGMVSLEFGDFLACQVIQSNRAAIPSDDLLAIGTGSIPICQRDWQFLARQTIQPTNTIPSEDLRAIGTETRIMSLEFGEFFARQVIQPTRAAIPNEDLLVIRTELGIAALEFSEFLARQVI